MRGTNPSHTTGSLPAPRFNPEQIRPSPGVATFRGVSRPQITGQQAQLRNRIQRRLETPQPSQPSIHALPVAPVPRRLDRPLSPDRRRLQRRKRRLDALRLDPYFLPRGPDINGPAFELGLFKRRRHHHDTTVQLHDRNLRGRSPIRESLPVRRTQVPHSEEPPRNLPGDNLKHTIRVFDENGVDRTAEYRRPTVSAGFLNSDIVVPASKPPTPSTDLRHHDVSSPAFRSFQQSCYAGRPTLNSLSPSDLESLRHRPRLRRPRYTPPPNSKRNTHHITKFPENGTGFQSNNNNTDFTDLLDLQQNLPTLSELPPPAVRQQTSTRPASTMFDMTEQGPLQKRLRTLSPVRTTSTSRFLLEPDARCVSFPLMEICPDSTMQRTPHPLFCHDSKCHTSVLSQLPWDPDAVSSEILDFESSLIDKPDLSVPQFTKNAKRPSSKIKTRIPPLSDPGVTTQFTSRVAPRRSDENATAQNLQTPTPCGDLVQDSKAPPEILVAVQLPSGQGNPIAQASER